MHRNFGLSPLLVDAEGKRLSVCAEKAELAAEFAHLLK